MLNDTIRGVKGIFDITRRLSTRPTLFRGQDVDRALIPRFARIAKERPYPDMIEGALYDRFVKESRAYLHGLLNEQSPILDWLSVAQHYGLPTRLLDWTSNALVALWFAVESATSEKLLMGDGKSRVLWVFEVGDDDILYPSQHTAHYSSFQKNHVFQPFHIDRRIPAQGAWFSLHRFRPPNEYVALDNTPEISGKLTRYYIDSDQAFAIKLELQQIGITPAALFPDLEGLSDAQTFDLQTERLHVAEVKKSKEGP